MHFSELRVTEVLYEYKHSTITKRLAIYLFLSKILAMTPLS